MIRVLVYVAFVFLVAAGFAWLAERPGDITLNWQGYQVQTSLMVAALALGLLIAGLAFIGWLVRKVVNAPRAFESFLGARRRDRGYRALSTGIIAVGAGDLRTAERSAREALGHLGNEPLAILLGAQAAQLAGDGDRARKAFETLAARPATKILGLHGLFIEARRQGEDEAARHFAEAAIAECAEDRLGGQRPVRVPGAGRRLAGRGRHARRQCAGRHRRCERRRTGCARCC